jgi:Tfp pilus assembly protein PilN
MANVLPPEEKKRVLREVRSRFVLTFAMTLLIGATVASLCLVPALISVRLATNSIPQDAELSQTVRDDQAKHARAFALVSALNPVVLATTTPSASVAAALAAKPAGVSVTGINYSKGRLLLNGVSRDRQAVNDYREALEADTRFSSVSVPVAALVGTQDGRFTITLSGQF